MNKSGIYIIQSLLKPERCYVGSAVNIKHRWRDHERDLLNNKHRNSRLQRHTSKYGIKDLSFSIVVHCEKEELIKNEQFFIDNLKPWFNLCLIAGSPLGIKRSALTRFLISKGKTGTKLSDESRKRQSDANTRKKPVFQYTKDGVFVKEWESIKSAARSLCIHRGHLCTCCKGKLKTCGGFIWKYKNVA